MHSEQQIRDLVSDFFGLDAGTVDKVLPEFRRVTLNGGDWLFQQGDPGDALYFLVRGRLQAWQDESLDSDGERKLLGEIGPGETVGEIALLTGERRTAGILARRDCLLLMLDRPAFERLTRHYPQLALATASRIAVRMHHLTTKRPDSGSRKLVNLCLVPIEDTPRTRKFLAALHEDLTRHGEVLSLSAESLPAIGAPVAGWDAANAVPQELASWVDNQESRHRFVLYHCSPAAPGWSAFAIRQADLIVLVGDAGTTSEVRDWERRLGEEQREYTAKRSLVLLHPDSSAIATGTAAWLVGRDTHYHFHVRDGDLASLQRVCRIFAGKGIGLVLGAGAARGFAHIGVYRAMVECGIPIDWIGGSSIGSIIGGAIAHGWTPDEVLENGRNAFVKNNPFRDPTLPMVSLLAGRKMMEQSRRYFSTCIEDLPIPFFCVSANIDDGTLNIHDRDPLYKAIQAAAALPVAMPPAVINRRLALDGALVNSLPVDLMRRLPVDKVIAVKVSLRKEFEVDYDEVPSAWTLFRSRWLGLGRSYRVPSIGTILLKSIELGTIDKTESLAKQADLLIQPMVRSFGMVDIQRFDDIVESGYQAAMAAFENWEGPRV